MFNNLSRRQIIKAAGIFFTRAASAGTISLISNLIARIPMVSAEKAPGILKRGAVYTLELCDHKKEPKLLYGETAKGKVELASKTTRSSATKWRVFQSGKEGNYSFKCQSDKKGCRWLDGRTAEGKVGLVCRVAGFSGTRWRVCKVNELGVYELECLGHIGGNRWLEGRTDKDETVRLASEDSRSSWRITLTQVD